MAQFWEGRSILGGEENPAFPGKLALGKKPWYIYNSTSMNFCVAVELIKKAIPSNEISKIDIFYKIAIK